MVSLLTIEFVQSCNQYLQLLVSEDGDKLLRDHLVEASEEEVYLPLDNAIHDIVYILLHVVMLVVICHIDERSSFDQIDILALVKVVLGVSIGQT